MNPEASSNAPASSVGICSFAGSMSTPVEVAQAADAAGLDAAWTGEFNDRSAIVAMAAMAHHTRVCRIGMIDAVTDDMLDAMGVAGTAEQVRAGITRRRRDFDHVALYSPSFTMTPERVRQNTLDLVQMIAP